MQKKQRSIFLIIGLLMISISQIFSHFIKTSDFISGSLMGIGIGFMLLACIRQNRKPTC